MGGAAARLDGFCRFAVEIIGEITVGAPALNRRHEVAASLDTRWGVNEEVQFDQHTAKICLNEYLQHCAAPLMAAFAPADTLHSFFAACLLSRRMFDVALGYWLYAEATFININNLGLAPIWHGVCGSDLERRAPSRRLPSREGHPCPVHRQQLSDSRAAAG